MCVRVCALIVAFALALGLAATADAQSLSSAPAPTFDPATSPFNLRTNSLFDVSGPPEGGPYEGSPYEGGPRRGGSPRGGPHATSMFEAGQIVDRPTADLRPRFHWGVIGSFIPHWSIPGSMGNLFFETPNSPHMSGRDFRVGVVRARQLGFEMGGSFVRKTVSSVHVQYGDPTGSGQIGSVTYTAPTDIHMTGVDAHLVIPFARIGERVQLGVLAGGGIAWLPETPLQKVIQGPPFYASPNSFTTLSSPPATGGFVRDDNFIALPLAPGARSVTTEGTLYDISPTDHFWMLLRGQLAADFLLAPPLKLRVAGGFHYPGTQALGVDVVYLFRTGRVGTAQGQPADPLAASPAQVADRPQVIAPRRSYWGLLGGVTPQWWAPDSWGPMFEPDDPVTVEGREFRIGLTRGRPLGREFGVSFVLKSFTEFLFERQGAGFSNTAQGVTSAFLDAVQPSHITLSQIEPVQVPGVDFHAFVPIGRLGSRVQLGALMGAGIARVPSTPIRKRIEGPSFFASPTNPQPFPTPPASGGFVVDDHGEALPVAPGQTATTEIFVSAIEISPLGETLILARGQLAADILLAAPFKLRFSGGFNYPGAQLFGVEMVYMFGTGR